MDLVLDQTINRHANSKQQNIIVFYVIIMLKVDEIL